MNITQINNSQMMLFQVIALNFLTREVRGRFIREDAIDFEKKKQRGPGEAEHRNMNVTVFGIFINSQFKKRNLLLS